MQRGLGSDKQNICMFCLGGSEVLKLGREGQHTRGGGHRAVFYRVIIVVLNQWREDRKPHNVRLNP